MATAKPKLHIYFILDGSGSMAGVQEDVVGGLNQFITDQQELDNNDTLFTLTVFDTNVRKVYDNEKIKNVSEVTKQSTLLGGMTALLDSIGKTLADAEKVKYGKNDKKLVVIYTDGGENSSYEYTNQALKSSIERLEGDGWNFLFMSADFDNFGQAQALGLGQQYLRTQGGKVGTQSTFGAVSRGASFYKSGVTSGDYAAAAASVTPAAMTKLIDEEKTKLAVPVTGSDPGDEDPSAS